MPIVNEFGRYRLLTFDHDPVTRGPTVEVAHEALLREWPLLRGWLQESREDVRRQRLLAIATRQWQANHEDDSYLLRGSRLTSFEAWAETTTVALTTDEHAFLQTSITTRDTRHAAEAARRQRELETAQKLAETERERAEAQAQTAHTLRQRALILAGALVVAAVLAITAVGFARSSNNNANLATTREAEAREAYSLSLAANARQALDADNQPLALLLALAANSVDDPPLASWHTLVDIAYAPGVNRQFVHDSPINAVDVSPDGNYLLTGSDDGLVLLWDAASGEVVQRLDGHPASVLAVAFSPDGKWALSGSADDTAVLWNLRTGEMVQRLVGHKGDVSGVAFTPDGQYAVTSEDTAAAPSDLIVWDLTNGDIMRRFGSDEGSNQEGILDMALSSDGRTALVGQFSYAGTNEHTLALWDVSSGEPIHLFTEMDQTIEGVAISPDGRFGLAAAEGDLLTYWDLATGELVQRLQGHEGAVIAVSFSADGKQAISAGLDQTIIWWDLITGTIIRRLHSGEGEIHSLHFLGDTQAVTAATDGSLQIWDLTSAWQLARWGADGSGHQPPAPGPETRGMGLTISPDGRYALSGGNDPDTDLILWDYETGTALRHMTGNEGSIFDIAFTPDGNQALTAMQDGTLILWDIAAALKPGSTTGNVIRRLEGHQGSVNSVEISSDGRYAISGSLGGGVIYWDLHTGEILQRMFGHFEGRGVYDVAFLPGEQQAVSSSWDGSMIVWDLQSGEQLQRLTGLTGGVGSHFSADGDWGIHGISLSPDGKHLLSAGRDESLLLWDISTALNTGVISGESLRRFIGHAGFVVDVAFAPDGQTALSTARNDAIIVWDVAAGTPIRRLPINNRLNSSFRPTLALHPDGRSALSTEADGTILKWQLAEPSPTALITWLAAHRHVRELTCAERETYGIEPLCVDGAATATTADLPAAVLAATQSLDTQPAPVEVPTPQPVPTHTMAANFRGTAVLGNNLGELTRHRFDVWTYEGKAGEVLQFRMIADNPLTDVTIPLDARYDAGVLDTLLFVIAPDGKLLIRANDDPADDGTFFSDVNDAPTNGGTFSDANIEAVVLPEDGVYRIEARSFLDDGAGSYTLRITSRAYTANPAVLQDYVGHYLEGPWEYDVFPYVENGRLYLEIAQIAQSFDLIPLSETEFIDSDGNRIVFLRDENGNVTGYRIWISLMHPIGGQWYEAAKLEE